MAGKSERFKAKYKHKAKKTNNPFKKNGYGFSRRRVAYLPKKKKTIFDGTGGFDLDHRGRIRGTYIDGIFYPD